MTEPRQRRCTFPGCANKHNAGGLCTGHYAQQQLGKPLVSLRVLGHSALRDESGRKWCTRCKTWQEVSAYYPEPARQDGMSHYCRRCTRDYRLRRAYSITIEQFEEMLAAQDGVCAICGSGPGRRDHLAVDHNHSCCPGVKSCGRCVRGLLCERCNQAIGLLADDPGRLESAIAYLKGSAV